MLRVILVIVGGIRGQLVQGRRELGSTGGHTRGNRVRQGGLGRLERRVAGRPGGGQTSLGDSALSGLMVLLLR